MRRAAPLLLAAVLGACAAPSDPAPEAGYYARLETELRAAGYMRTDRSPRDATFTSADLVRNFEAIALFSEYGRVNDRFVQRREETILSKWVDPIRIRLVFGPSVEPAQMAEDRRNVAEFGDRLGRLTGLDVRLVRPGEDSAANFIVIFANREERREIARELSSSGSEPDPAFLDSLANSPPSEICYVNTFWDPEVEGQLAFAVTVIKSETRGLMRLSCVHEELAQALGLGNDDERVRPSIFNDDEEFALLTEHDEYLLRMLYDPRLRPGMTRAEAEPLLPEIAADVLGRF